MFLDGDAFPVADPMPLIEDGLARAPADRRAQGGEQRRAPAASVLLRDDRARLACPARRLVRRLPLAR
jgi:hypothetical protein